MASAASIAPAKARKAALARTFGVSRQAIGDLVKRGILSEDKDGLIDVELARHAIEQRVRPSAKTAQALTEPAAAPPPPAATDAQTDGTITSYHVAKTLNEAAQARMNQLKLREMQGDLIRVADVRATLAHVFATTREALLQLPARMAPLLAAESDTAAVQNLLHAEIHAALDTLAKSPDTVGTVCAMAATEGDAP